MQDVEGIKKKKENIWFGCNNAKGKDKIDLRMERKNKEWIYDDNQGKNLGEMPNNGSSSKGG